MGDKHPLYVCLGSACHQQGGYRLIPALQDLIRRHRLEHRVELRGAFCLESCDCGRSLQWDGRVFAGVTEESLRSLFQQEVVPRVVRQSLRHRGAVPGRASTHQPAETAPRIRKGHGRAGESGVRSAVGPP